MEQMLAKLSSIWVTGREVPRDPRHLFVGVNWIRGKAPAGSLEFSIWSSSWKNRTWSPVHSLGQTGFDPHGERGALIRTWTITKLLLCEEAWRKCKAAGAQGPGAWEALGDSTQGKVAFSKKVAAWPGKTKMKMESGCCATEQCENSGDSQKYSGSRDLQRTEVCLSRWGGKPGKWGQCVLIPTGWRGFGHLHFPKTG